MGLASDLAAATQLKAAGMKVFLDLEYSDAPTSSTAQATPAAWAGQPLATLARTVQSYTTSVLKAFAANGTPVAQVQIGNDVTQGLLWPTGQLSAGPGGPGWGPLATLLKAGAAGARAGNPARNPLAVQIGIDAGADTTSSLDFFDHVEAAGVTFDQIGETYSPWTQGPLTSLESTLRALIARFGKPVVISAGQFPYADVTGYGSYSDTVPYPDTLPGYLITPAGQASYERDLVSLLAALPGGLGRGAFYLAPQTASALGEFTPAGAAEPAVDAYRVGSGAAGQDPSVPPVSAVPAGTPPAQPSQPATTGNAALPGTLPPLPSGLNAAIGARVSANSGAAPGTSLAGVNDGDGTTRWCPSSAGVHQVTVDLGHVEDVTGTGITFSGQQSGDGATYRVSAGVSRPGQTRVPASGRERAGRHRPRRPVPVLRVGGRRDRHRARPVPDPHLPGAARGEHLRAGVPGVRAGQRAAGGQPGDRVRPVHAAVRHRHLHPGRAADADPEHLPQRRAELRPAAAVGQPGVRVLRGAVRVPVLRRQRLPGPGQRPDHGPARSRRPG